MNFLKTHRFGKLIPFFVFYGWNIFFLITFITLESSERVFSELVYNAFTSYTPMAYFWHTLILALLPPACLILGIFTIKDDGMKLLKLFYGFEVPLIFLTMFRVFGFHQLTTEIFYWFIAFYIPVIGYGLILMSKRPLPSFLVNLVNVFKSMVGLGLGVFLMLYVIPIAWIVLTAIFENIDNIGEIFEAGFLGLILILFFSLTGTLFFFFPIALMFIYVRDGILGIITRYQQSTRSIQSVLFATILLIFLVFPRKQPQIEAMKMVRGWLDGEVESTALLENENMIRDGLLNANLWDYRYIDYRDDRGLLEEVYREAFDTKPGFIKDIQEFLISPFVYDGERGDVQKSSRFYELVFDQPIERAEAKTMIEAIRNSWRFRDVQATLLDIDQKLVLVTDRDISYKELEDGVVQVDFHERYVNRSYQNQEVFYYFSLPENTVITGLWLGDDDDKPRFYPYTIAPRGAAQKTYQEIRQVRRDPALLEQVGPYQYRLRIFPIQFRDHVRFGQDREETIKPMHLSLRLLCKTDNEGKIALPRLTEKRNVYWTEESLPDYEEDEWFPSTEETLNPSSNVTKALLANHELEILDLDELPKEKMVLDEFVFLVDGSYSMRQHREELINHLETFPFLKQSKFIFIERDTNEAINLDDIGQAEFVGYSDLLPQLDELNADYPNAHFVFLTDKGSYELLYEASSRKTVALDGKLDIIHFNGYAPIYEDAFIETATGSGGYVYTSFEDWLYWQLVKKPETDHSWQEGKRLYTFNKLDSNELHKSSAFDPYFYSRLAMAQSRDRDSLSVSDLDEIHELAVKHSFISPFSSMICLVDEQQKKMLEEFSSREDRFERTVETGKSTTLGVVGTPEPHEWMLIIFAGLLGLYLYRKQLLERLGFRV